MTEVVEVFWKKCSVCKNNINYASLYYVCSVSTCNGQRTGLAFCRMQCFESHLPGARHRDAGAVEMRSPSGPPAGTAAATASTDRGPHRLIVRPAATGTTATVGSFGNSKTIPNDVLIIASRLKEYITARADMNTSANVMEALSDHLRFVCDRGIENAKADGRKTIMDRDFQFLKNLK